MIQVIQLQGTDKRLYELVAPLVMNPEILKQNYNYPFRTSENFVWFVAINKRKVIGFIPVEEKKKECIINNYYIEGNNEDTLKLLLEKVISETNADKELISITFMEHCSLFKELGFSEEKVWTRYVKMKKDR
ncbi:hypothetical protein [uncultured Bacteroides sp.]|jgi:hypothetical protein|uniref:hypothetical protein n=1 Tax=uncultured Bacteroides sp. TaxID=162156 RepID=UPI00280AD062|nr:hypothetical protein [uncultured Bacteroides sp.]